MATGLERVGRYEVIGRIAEGGMAEILLARLAGPSGFVRPVVVKRILPQLARNATFVAMFSDEARIIAGIRHPNVVQVQEFGAEKEQLYLAMEFLEGESVAALSKRLRTRSRALDPAIAAFIVAEAAAGLHAAHELRDAEGRPQELVHRDVNPQNVFVTYDGAVKLLDFGIAKAADRIVRTEAGQFKGKYAYMSPEQWRGEELDRRSDVFALGTVLYELSVGRRLFHRSSPMGSMRAICTEPLVPPSRVEPKYPAKLEPIVIRALSRDKERRYATALEMRRDLLAFVREAAGEMEPAEAVSKLMHEMFEDRRAEKAELVRQVRAGATVGELPPAETDASVEIPTVLEAISKLEPIAPRRRTWPWVVLAAAIASVATVFGLRASQSVSTKPAPPPSSAAIAAAPSVSASASVPPPAAPAEISVSLDSIPTGAHAWVDGVDRGPTPIQLSLPRSNATVRLELRRPGFETLAQELMADVDQRLVLSLHAARHGAPRSSAGTEIKPWNE